MAALKKRLFEDVAHKDPLVHTHGVHHENARKTMDVRHQVACRRGDMSCDKIDPTPATAVAIIEIQIVEGLAACKSTTEIAQIIAQTFVRSSDIQDVRLKIQAA